MTYIFSGLTRKTADAYRAGALDAYGNAAEHGVSIGTGVPCRHCLKSFQRVKALSRWRTDRLAPCNPMGKLAPSLSASLIAAPQARLKSPKS